MELEPIRYTRHHVKVVCARCESNQYYMSMYFMKTHLFESSLQQRSAEKKIRRQSPLVATGATTGAKVVAVYKAYRGRSGWMGESANHQTLDSDRCQQRVHFFISSKMLHSPCGAARLKADQRRSDASTTRHGISPPLTPTGTRIHNSPRSLFICKWTSR